MAFGQHHTGQERIPHNPRDLLLIAVLGFALLVLFLAMLSGVDLLGRFKSMSGIGWFQAAVIAIVICGYFLLLQSNRGLEVGNRALANDAKREREVTREKLDRLDASLTRGVSRDSGSKN